MRTLTNNREVFHLWAHQTQDSARGHGSVSFSGKSAYSYQTEIGRIEVNKKGVKAYFLGRRSYSVTTSKHQGYCASAVPPGELEFHVSGARWGGSLDTTPKTLIADYRESIRELAVNAKRARSRKDWKLRYLLEKVSEANRYAQWAGIRTRFTVPTDTDLAKLEAEAEAQARKNAAARKVAEAKREADRLERAREASVRLADWLNGANIQPGWDWRSLFGTSHARIEGAELVTCQGARVPLDHVSHAKPFITRILESGQEWTRNGSEIRLGHYTVNQITVAGAVYIGCHYFDPEETRRILAMLP